MYKFDELMEYAVTIGDGIEGRGDIYSEEGKGTYTA